MKKPQATKQTGPKLVAPKAMPSSFQEYIQRVVDEAGTDYAVGVHLGYSDGSRVGTWRRGQGRPDELACVKLARWMGDNPTHVLRLAGYTEMADALDGRVQALPPSMAQLKPMLQALSEMLSATLKVTE